MADDPKAGKKSKAGRAMRHEPTVPVSARQKRVAKMTANAATKTPRKKVKAPPASKRQRTQAATAQSRRAATGGY